MLPFATELSIAATKKIKGRGDNGDVVLIFVKQTSHDNRFLSITKLLKMNIIRV